MPCNRATSITKAAVPAAHLAQLLGQDAAEALLRAVIEPYGFVNVAGSWNQGTGADVQGQYGVPLHYEMLRDANSVSRRNVLNREPGSVTMRVGGDWGFDVVIRANGEVYMATTSPRQDAFARQITEQVADAVRQTVELLFAQQIQAVLAQVGSVQSQAVQVEDDGQLVAATKLTLSL